MKTRRRTIGKPCYEHALSITSVLADPSRSYNEMSRQYVATYHVINNPFVGAFC
jgi:hypothetical protein